MGMNKTWAMHMHMTQKGELAHAGTTVVQVWQVFIHSIEIQLMSFTLINMMPH